MAAQNTPKAKTVEPATGRVETYSATKPNGDVVTVTHNLDTGETTVS